MSVYKGDYSRIIIPDGYNFRIETTCSKCKKTFKTRKLTWDKWDRFRRGENPEDVFNKLRRDEIKLFFVTGVCRKCSSKRSNKNGE